MNDFHVRLTKKNMNIILGIRSEVEKNDVFGVETGWQPAEHNLIKHCHISLHS